jgi:hypothetical protein
MSSGNSFAGFKFDDSLFQLQESTMCPRYQPLKDADFVKDVHVRRKNHGDFEISGLVRNSLMAGNVFVSYTAPAPPTYNSSFSGGGLPFPNEEIAFENTGNRGVVPVEGGRFRFTIRYPNSYYTHMGNNYIGPHVRLVLVNEIGTRMSEEMSVPLGEGIPFRTLSSPPQRTSPLFYEGKDVLPIRTQYQILIDSKYPSINHVPKNFWGTMPPH